VARPARLARVRERFAGAGIDAYFGVRPEHMRYLTGFALDDGEEKNAGVSGQFLVGAQEVVLFADSRYTIQAARQAPDARIEDVYGDLPRRWPALVASLGARRVAVEAAVVSKATWDRLAGAAPDVELVPVEGGVEADRAIKEPGEIERIAAACAVADRALAGLLPAIRVGRTERELALELELAMRTGGADALAFDVACLSGPEAALPHGGPGDRPVRERAVLLFDFGAQVAGYRSDMTRTLFVGEPQPRDLALYELVAAAQAASITGIEAAVQERRPISGQAADAIAREVIEAAGHGAHFGHGTGHGIGLATHELPSLGKRAPDAPLPSPTVFSVEPGVYLEGETGVRIEDLVVYDTLAGKVERLTRFPREVLVVG
jgi:Xaa-Pro aminopeptidase